MVERLDTLIMLAMLIMSSSLDHKNSLLLCRHSNTSTTSQSQYWGALYAYSPQLKVFFFPVVFPSHKLKSLWGNAYGLYNQSVHFHTGISLIQSSGTTYAIMYKLKCFLSRPISLTVVRDHIRRCPLHTKCFLLQLSETTYTMPST